MERQAGAVSAEVAIISNLQLLVELASSQQDQYTLQVTSRYPWQADLLLV